MSNNPTKNALRQDVETSLTTVAVPFGTVLYLYARSADSVVNHTIGQDYVIYRFDDSNLTFAVCDGVGQSFMGDLAARVLGEGLIDWLWTIDRPANEAAFADALITALNEMTVAGKTAVTAYQLPDSLPALVKQALEMQRQYGSESMFVAGRIALGSDSWVALCWLGDSPVAAIDIDGELVDLGPKGGTAERWNALTGVKGTPHTWISDADRVARVAGYTDGLGVEHVPTDDDLEAMMTGWLSNPPSDDASLFDVRLAHSPETVGEPDLEDLKKLQSELKEIRPDKVPIKARSKPIDIKPEETPVTGSEPIALPAPGKAVEGWRPLTDQKEEAVTDSTSRELVPQGHYEERLAELVWHQIQSLKDTVDKGLVNPSLALVILNRLLKVTKDRIDPDS